MTNMYSAHVCHWLAPAKCPGTTAATSAEDEDFRQVGEDESTYGRRGGGGLSAMGTFAMSGGSNRAGNDESLL